MKWSSFVNKFHNSWHSVIKKWIESEDADKVYSFLKSVKGSEIAPISNLTFRAFEQPLNKINVVLIFEEPFHNKKRNVQYADGIALSCEYNGTIHQHLNEFYDALEREFYDLSLGVVKNSDLSFYINQGVLFLNSSLTTEIDSPGKHKGLWVTFMGMLIKDVFSKKGIPIVFCGKEVYQEYTSYLEPQSKNFIIKQSLQSVNIGEKWDTENVFTHVNSHLDSINKEEILWLNVELPF